MKTTLKQISLIFIVLLLFSCGGEEKKKESPKIKIGNQTTTKVETKTSTKASETIDLSNKGVGPISSLSLPEEIDQAMVTKGADVFKKMCTACHREGKKFIGPAPNGILKRRTPEWIMNMILDPDKMVKENPTAKELLAEYLSPMANQSLTQDEARAILEYFRTQTSQ